MQFQSVDAGDPALGRMATRVNAFDYRVGGTLLPANFESYTRILHPFCDPSGNWDVTWNEVAHWSGRILHPLAQWPVITSPAKGQRIASGGRPFADDDPHDGMTEAQFASLARHLEKNTTSPEDCYFAFWARHGPGIRSVKLGPCQEPHVSGPVLELPKRSYLVYRGSLSVAPKITISFDDIQMSYSPNLWWPADEAWAVSSDIDLQSSYVGGSNDLARSLSSDASLEAFTAQPDDLVSVNADRINL